MQIKNNEMNILVEALPYLSAFKGKTVVVKYGGNAMLNDDLKNKVLEDIVFLRCAGMHPVVVHGGGPEITAMLKAAGKKPNSSAACGSPTKKRWKSPNWPWWARRTPIWCDA